MDRSVVVRDAALEAVVGRHLRLAHVHSNLQVGQPVFGLLHWLRAVRDLADSDPIELRKVILLDLEDVLRRLVDELLPQQ